MGSNSVMPISRLWRAVRHLRTVRRRENWLTAVLICSVSSTCSGKLIVVLALGKMGFDGYLRMLRERGYDLPRLKFVHGAWHELPDPLPVLAACYHPSRQNTSTGRLTQEMIDAVFVEIRDYIDG